MYVYAIATYFFRTDFSALTFQRFDHTGASFESREYWQCSVGHMFWNSWQSSLKKKKTFLGAGPFSFKPIGCSRLTYIPISADVHSNHSADVHSILQIWLSGVSKRVRDRTLPIFTWLKACACVVKSLKSQCWKVSSEKIHCNGVNVHLYKFLKINIQPFKTYFSMYEHLLAESHLQGFKTGKQWNTLLEQCQIWNSANVQVKLFELWKHVCEKKKILWKCVGENDEEDKIEHKIMFTDVWIFVWIFFRL